MTAELREKTRTVWQCSRCGMAFIRSRNAREHIVHCSADPDHRACRTCDLRVKNPAGLPSCELGLRVPEFGMVWDCASWQPRPCDRHQWGDWKTAPNAATEARMCTDCREIEVRDWAKAKANA